MIHVQKHVLVPHMFQCPPLLSLCYIVYCCSKDVGFIWISSLNVSQIVVCLLHAHPVVWSPLMQETFASGLNPYSVHGMTEIEQSGLKYRFGGLLKWCWCEMDLSGAFHIRIKLIYCRIFIDLPKKDVSSFLSSCNDDMSIPSEGILPKQNRKDLFRYWHRLNSCTNPAAICG